SQTAVVAGSKSSDAVPAGSARHRAEQQSPSAWLPSSQFSRGSITPFPHLVRKKNPEGQLGDVKVPESSSPSPVPLNANSGQNPVISPATENAPVPRSTLPVAQSGSSSQLPPLS